MAVTNLIGNGVATIVVAKWRGAIDEARFSRGLAGRAMRAGEAAGAAAAFPRA